MSVLSSSSFTRNDAFFYIFKHTLANPDCILTKSVEKRKKKILYKLVSKKINQKFDNLDSLIFELNKRNLKII